jgi:hypothetical protein
MCFTSCIKNPKNFGQRLTYLAMLSLSLFVACSSDSGNPSASNEEEISSSSGVDASSSSGIPGLGDKESSSSVGGISFVGGPGSCEQLAVGESVALDGAALLEIARNLSFSKEFAAGVTWEIPFATSTDYVPTRFTIAQDRQISKSPSFTKYAYQFGGNLYEYTIFLDGSAKHHFHEGESSNKFNEMMEMIQSSKKIGEYMDGNISSLERTATLSRDSDGCVLEYLDNFYESDCGNDKEIVELCAIFTNIYFKNDAISIMSNPANLILDRYYYVQTMRPATAAELELPVVFNDLEAFVQKAQENM